MKIFAIAWKDNLVRFSARSELLFFLILPLIFTLLLGGAGVGGPSSTPLAVVDEDVSALSAQFLAALQADEQLEVQLLSAQAARQMFDEGDVAAWVTIPVEFEKNLLAGQDTALDFRKQANDTQADGAEQAVYAAVAVTNRSLAVAQSSLRAALMRDEALDQRAYLSAGLDAAAVYFSQAPQNLLVTRPLSQGQTEYDQGTQASNGQLITWVFIPLVGISGIFAFERSRKTMARLVVAPVHKATYLLGVLTGQIGAAFVQMAILMVVGVYGMGIYWGDSIVGLLLVLVTFSLSGAALGVMLGTWTKSEAQASNLSIMIGMVMALLGGCWWPIELFPPVVSKFSQLLPTYWAMTGLNNLSMRGLGLDAALLPSAVLLGFALVFFGVGLVRFRYE